jgi:hypothetical protein
LSCFAPNLTHHFDDFLMWSGNHKFYIQFSRLLRLQSFRITLYKADKINEKEINLREEEFVSNFNYFPREKCLEKDHLNRN